MWAEVMKMHMHFGPADMHYDVYEMKMHRLCFFVTQLECKSKMHVHFTTTNSQMHVHYTTTEQNQGPLTLAICVHLSPNAYAF